MTTPPNSPDPLEGPKWSSSAITWSFAASNLGSSSTFSSFLTSSVYQALVKKAVALWSAVSGIATTLVTDSAATDIRVGFETLGSGSTGEIGLTAYSYTNRNGSETFLPGTTVGLEDPAQDALIATADGDENYASTSANLFQVITHEIGHALGLDHNMVDTAAIMSPVATSTNRSIDTNDAAALEQLYGGSATAAAKVTIVDAGPDASTLVGGATAHLFANLVVTDGASLHETVTVTLTGSGTLSDPTAGTDAKFAGGVFTESGDNLTATDYAQTILNRLVYTAPSTVAKTSFSVEVDNSLQGSATNAAISVIPVSPDPLFDAAYYLANNPDVAAAGVDPYTHYMTYGWKEGRNPEAYFNTNYYLNQNPDIKAAGINPLTHFEAYGWKEGRDPSVLFSDAAYLAAYPDVKAAAIDPLQQYIQSGKAAGRTAFAAPPHPTGPQDPLVNAAYVYANNPAVAAAGLDASAWYNSVGWQQGANPDAYFDTNYYLAQNPDVKAAGVDPLSHFEAYGWKEGRQPSLVFNDAGYSNAYPDVKAAGVDPLLHYIQSGQNEGRLTFIAPGTATADPLVPASYYDAQLGATLIPSGTAGAQQAAYAYDHGGWQAGLNPDAFFNTAYYLAHNPDVAAAHVDPLLHYETYGWKEGRNPSALFSTNAYLNANPDVKAAGVDPLLHYVDYGQGEGRAIYAAPA